MTSVLYKEDLGTGTPTPVTPEIERVKRNQEHISSVLYKEDLGTGTPTPVTPEVERVKRNQEHISSVFCGGGEVFPLTPLKQNFLTFIKNEQFHSLLPCNQLIKTSFLLHYIIFSNVTDLTLLQICNYLHYSKYF
uniref:Uncharacterized protein n=1 Tax=Bubo bubo TaxID=30461 RepID=A0A8C0FAA3_BUBBB